MAILARPINDRNAHLKVARYFPNPSAMVRKACVVQREFMRVRLPAVRCGDVKGAMTHFAPHHGGEDNMTTSRINAVAVALCIAFGFVAGAGSTQDSAKEQNLSVRIASSKRMADDKEWTTANLNVNTSSSYCYDDAERNCRRYGRLYTWESAQRGCQSLAARGENRFSHADV